MANPIMWGMSKEQFATPENRYVTNTTNAYLDKTAGVLENKYKTNKSVYEGLLSTINDLSLQVRDNNSPQVKAALEQAKLDLANYSNTGSNAGQWEFAIDPVTKALHNYSANMELKGATADYEAYQADIAKLQAMVKEGTLTQSDYVNIMAHNQKSNVAPVTFNKDTYSYGNIYSGITPAESVDMPQQAMDMIEGWQSDKTPFTLVDGREVLYTIKNGVPGYYTTIGTESVSYDEVLNAAMMKLQQTPKNQAWVNQQMMFDKNANAQVDEQGGYLKDENGNIVYNEINYRDKLGSEFGLTPEQVDKYAIDPRTGKPNYEELYNSYKIDSYYRNAAQPAAMKASYIKQTADNLKNWQSEVALQHQNDLDLLAKKAAYEREAKKYEYDLANPKYANTLESKLQADETYDVAEKTKAIEFMKDGLKVYEQKIANGETLSPQENLNYDNLKDNVKLQETLENKRIIEYMKLNPNTEIDKLYEEYLNISGDVNISDRVNTALGGVNNKPMSKVEFVKELVKNTKSTTALLTSSGDINNVATLTVKSLYDKENPILNPNSNQNALSYDAILNDYVKPFAEGLNTYAKSNTTATGYDFIPVKGTAEINHLNSLINTGGKIAVAGELNKDGSPVLISTIEEKYPSQYYEKQYSTVVGEPNKYGITYKLKQGKDADGAYINNSGDYGKDVGGEFVKIYEKSDLVKTYETMVTNYEESATEGFGVQASSTAMKNVVTNLGIDKNGLPYTNLDDFNTNETFVTEGDRAAYILNRDNIAVSTIGKQLDNLKQLSINDAAEPRFTITKSGEFKENTNVDIGKATDNNGKPYVVVPVKKEGTNAVLYAVSDNDGYFKDGNGGIKYYASVNDASIAIYSNTNKLETVPTTKGKVVGTSSTKSTSETENTKL